MTVNRLSIPDVLARELCEALNLWDGGFYNIDEDELVEHFLAPVIAKHIAEAVDAERMAHNDAFHPPRTCCWTRAGGRHAAGCVAIRSVLADGLDSDIEGRDQ